MLLLAACAPRAVLGHGVAHAPSGPPGTVMPDPTATSSAPGAFDTTDLLTTSVVPTTSAAPAMSAVPTTSAGEPTAVEPASGVVISRLPSPHRLAAAETPAPRTVADAFALVGQRDPREPLAFALAVAASLASHPTPSLTTGPALVAWAREQGMWSAPASMMRPGGDATTGDLLVYDRAVEDAPASLVGVVLATDDRGVIAFLYLARGVVRIGHVDITRPAVARDRDRRTVNSYIRHTTDYPPTGTHYLAGELLAGGIRLSSSK